MSGHQLRLSDGLLASEVPILGLASRLLPHHGLTESMQVEVYVGFVNSGNLSQSGLR